jgi:uncharacterized membrane protein YozB (DUF420 family)
MLVRSAVVAAAVLALLGIGVSIEHFATGDHYNRGFYEFPVVIGLHVVLGAVYLGLALHQLLPAARARSATAHRVVGRGAALAGFTAGTTALVILVLFPFSGRAELLAAGPFGVWFLFSLARGVVLARAGRYEEHREWMIRAFAIATGIATMRLIFVPALFAFGEATDERARFLSVVSFAVAFSVHTLAAELWIRATRSQVVRFSP